MIAACEHDTFHIGKPSGFEDIEQAAGVDLEECFQIVVADDTGQMHDGADALHHSLDRWTVCHIGNDCFLVVRQVLDRPDVGQAQMPPVRAQAVAQSGADRARRAGDQHAVGVGIDHGPRPAPGMRTAWLRRSAIPSSIARG